MTNLLRVNINPEPERFYALIEIPSMSLPVKYEYNKEFDCMVVDRILSTSMTYPCNYGFIPRTLHGDGDPVDVLVVTQFPIIVGALIEVRPLSVLRTKDESGVDDKILAVPINNNSNDRSGMVCDYIPQSLMNKIEHFFINYKTLENNKWVSVGEWQDINTATSIVAEGFSNFNIVE